MKGRRRRCRVYGGEFGEGLQGESKDEEDSEKCLGEGHVGRRWG
jgi:hypothetical protein